jgi:hypothetical protein
MIPNSETVRQGIEEAVRASLTHGGTCTAQLSNGKEVNFKVRYNGVVVVVLCDDEDEVSYNFKVCVDVE